MTEPPLPEVPPDGERVRVCPACGEVVAFERRTCPTCGHLDPLGSSEAATVPCPHCQQDMAERGLFCPHCGREREPEPLPAVAQAALEPEPRGGLDVLLLLLTLLGPAVLLVAVLLVYA